MKQIITIICCLAWLNSSAQKTYLRIFKNGESNKVISYPPGTQFDLKNQHGYIQLKYSETPRVFEINEPFTIHVYPSYKKGKDVFQLKKGAVVELAKTPVYQEIDKITNKKDRGILDASFTSMVTESIKYKGKKNLKFTYETHTVFQYIDGTYEAFYKGQKVEITGKYLIPTPEGTLKISFNDESGKVWWIFEKKN